MAKTVVGLFNTTAQAQQVKQALIAQGYDSSDIKIVANDHSEGHAEGEGIGHKISHFFSSLSGGDEETSGYYTKGVTEGGALLSVDTDAEDAEDVAATLQQHGARIEGGSYGQGTGAYGQGTGSYGQGTGAYGQGTSGYAQGTGDYSQGTSGYTQQGATTTSGEVIPVVEEQLVVGKREVDRGGVRVFSRVVENPVSADVTLRDEYINVERRTVDRPATEADFQTGNAAFELRASGEEAVVGKASRVVEEVLVGKEATQHTEEVHDTVRRTEVDVEDLGASAATSGTLAGTTTDKDRF